MAGSFEGQASPQPGEHKGIGQRQAPSLVQGGAGPLVAGRAQQRAVEEIKELFMLEYFRL